MIIPDRYMNTPENSKKFLGAMVALIAIVSFLAVLCMFTKLNETTKVAQSDITETTQQ